MGVQSATLTSGTRTFPTVMPKLANVRSPAAKYLAEGIWMSGSDDCEVVAGDFTGKNVVCVTERPQSETGIHHSPPTERIDRRDLRR